MASFAHLLVLSSIGIFMHLTISIPWNVMADDTYPYDCGPNVTYSNLLDLEPNSNVMCSYENQTYHVCVAEQCPKYYTKQCVTVHVANPNNCTTFFKCTPYPNGTLWPMEMPCGAGTYYNTKTGNCACHIKKTVTMKRKKKDTTTYTDGSKK